MNGGGRRGSRTLAWSGLGTPCKVSQRDSEEEEEEEEACEFKQSGNVKKNGLSLLSRSDRWRESGRCV